MVGKAGEYAVSAQLLLRNVPVLWPSVDQGYDLETGNHCRIQVKCGHLSDSDGRGQTYMFMLKKRKPVPSIKGTSKWVAVRPLAEICDFVVFWGIEQNRFWVVPPELCDGCSGVRLGFEPITRPRLVCSLEEVKDMLKLGYTQREVANHYGVTFQTINRFLSEGRDWNETTVSQMRSCENKWESILNFALTNAAIPAKVEEA